MTRMDRVREYVDCHTLEAVKKGIQPGASASTVALDLQIHRSDASAELNALFKLGYVEKIGTRPVLYFSTRKTRRQTANAIDQVQSCYTKISETAQNSEVQVAFSGIIGSEGSIRAQIELAKAAVVYPPNGLHTLLYGESGVGKSLMAEAMWRYAMEIRALQSQANMKIPFVTFCCADYAGNSQLLLSQLFGYVKGAFTGADVEHEGLVDRAEGGILFLDEIHRLPPAGQELMFMLIDKGIYRRLGETRVERKAQLMLIGATSEDITSTLLTTFRRRIPMQIALPTLNERPVKERIALIAHFVDQETRRLGLPIWISGQALQVFSFYNCPANIGELRNDLLLCCAKSYLSYLAGSVDKLSVDVETIPQRIFSMARDEGVKEASIRRLFREGLLIEPRSQPLGQNMFHDYELPVDLYGFVDKRVDCYRQRRMADEEIEHHVSRDLEKYFNTAVQAFFKPGNTDIPTSIIQENIWEAANALLNEAARKLNRKFGRKTLVALALHMQQFKERAASGRIIYNPQLKKIAVEHAAAYDVVLENADALSQKLGFALPPDELGFISMFLTHTFEDVAKQRIGLIVAAHGRATAQNMVEVANNLLGTDHIKAFNIPLHKSTSMDELQKLVIAADEGKGVLLLVDMGFLVTTETTLSKVTNVSLRIVPNVTTALVLEAGRRILTMEESLDQATEKICSAYREYSDTLMQRRQGKVPMEGTIVAVCITGSGTAEKIRELLKEYVPMSNSMDIVTVSAADDVFQLVGELGPKLKLIIGNIDPGVREVPFVHVSELLTPGGLNHINSLILRGCAIEKQSCEEIGQKTDVFKLLAGQLNKFVKTLPPQKVASCCEEIVNRYEQLLCPNPISLDVLTRIYLHTACMFDRINVGEALVMPDWGDQVKRERAKEFEVVKSLVDEVSRKLNLNVSDAESCYFLIALPEIDEMIER